MANTFVVLSVWSAEKLCTTHTVLFWIAENKNQPRQMSCHTNNSHHLHHYPNLTLIYNLFQWGNKIKLCRLYQQWINVFPPFVWFQMPRPQSSKNCSPRNSNSAACSLTSWTQSLTWKARRSRGPHLTSLWITFQPTGAFWWSQHTRRSRTWWGCTYVFQTTSCNSLNNSHN